MRLHLASALQQVTRRAYVKTLQLHAQHNATQMQHPPASAALSRSSCRSSRSSMGYRRASSFSLAASARRFSRSSRSTSFCRREAGGEWDRRRGVCELRWGEEGIRRGVHAGVQPGRHLPIPTQQAAWHGYAPSINHSPASPSPPSPSPSARRALPAPSPCKPRRGGQLQLLRWRGTRQEPTNRQPGAIAPQ